MKKKVKIPNNKKIDLIKRTNIFSKLNEKELNIIEKYIDCYNYSKSDNIYVEGSMIDSLFIINYGEVRIIKNNEDFACFINGECFHELNLLDKEPENTTAIAEKNTNLLIFPKSGVLFNDILCKHPDISAKILYELLVNIAKRIREANKLISEKIPWIEDLRKKIKRDKLTGLYNIIYLEEDLPLIINQLGEKISLIMIKPDNFKDINDNFGHEAGDNTLKFISSFLKNSLRRNDIPIRYKGDEFAIILPNTETKDATHIAENLINKITSKNIKEFINNDFYLKFSMGIATYPDHTRDYSTFIKLSYDKMYEARNSGGNKFLSL